MGMGRAHDGVWVGPIAAQCDASVPQAWWLFEKKEELRVKVLMSTCFGGLRQRAGDEGEGRTCTSCWLLLSDLSSGSFMVDERTDLSLSPTRPQACSRIL
jgi:hypothetical protein